MKYFSTRGDVKPFRSTEAIIKGLADDKGLFVPTTIPKLDEDIKELSSMTYKQIATLVLSKFFPDYTQEEISFCVDNAYDTKFDAEDVVDMVSVKDVNILELYHGKTSAFKDMALSILPYLVTVAMKKEGEEKKLCILTATSGDTGKAALEGFCDVDNTKVIVFYPKEGVSKVQERQMLTQEGKNVRVIGIKGNFDDAQSGVKAIFNDEKINKMLGDMGIKLSSANSINIGRLIPQVAYYVYGYANMVKKGVVKAGEKVNVVVPTGNFGNILAAYYAKLMGIPFDKFICASNENNVLTDFINTGIYDINREFILTQSPSMDILISSNLERLLYLLSKGDTSLISDLMNQLQDSGKYEITQDMKENLKVFYGGYADDRQTLEVIGRIFGEDGYLMDTHTAVAYKVYEQYKKETQDDTKTLIVSTASPYKFADSVCKAIGVEISEDGFENLNKLYEYTKVDIPKGLKDLDKKKILFDEVIESNQMKNSVLDK